jgi:hypothetical protein
MQWLTANGRNGADYHFDPRLILRSSNPENRYVSCGSIVRITAPQQQWKVHLQQRTLTKVEQRRRTVTAKLQMGPAPG